MMREVQNANTSRCFCVECSSYYWKDLNSKSATAVLLKLPVGSFLLRPSQNPNYQYTLSQKDRENGVSHIRIGRDESGGYLMDTDESAADLSLVRFSCVVNMIKCWSKVFRDIGKRCLLTPVSRQIDNENPIYINEDRSSICFHDDEEAARSFRNFFAAVVQRKP